MRIRRSWLTLSYGLTSTSVVNKETSLQRNRLETLKKLASTYKDLMKTRRETLRKLARKTGNDSSELRLKQGFATRLAEDLGSMLTKLRVEQVGVEALLARRKQAEGAATDPTRKEISRLEDQIAALVAQQKAVQSELEQLVKDSTIATEETMELSDLQDELKQIEESSRKINTELEILTVELQAPPQISLIEEAQPGSTDTIAASISGRSQ